MKNFKEQYKPKVIHELIGNKLEILFPNGDAAVITEANMVSESMKLKQSVCDESQLRFGGCIASEFSIQLMNTEERSFGIDLVGKWINVRLTQTFPNGNYLYPKSNIYPSKKLLPGEVIMEQEWYLFSGYIDSAQLDKNDKNIRNLVAYDALALLNQADGTDKLYHLWQVFPTGCTLNNLLVHCLQYNDTVIIGFDFGRRLEEKIPGMDYGTIQNYPTMNKSWLNNHNKITYGLIVKNVCEMLGVWGFMRANGAYGEFNMIYTSGTETYDFYEQFYAEEYTTKGYSGVTLMIGIDSERTSKTTTFASSILEDDENYYDLTDNIICWQEKESTGWVHPFQEIYNDKITDARLSGSTYTPMTATVDYRPWVEVGDKIKINTYKTDVNGDYILDADGNKITETVESYVLSRTITGIQALTDQIEAKGVQ